MSFAHPLLRPALCVLAWLTLLGLGLACGDGSGAERGELPSATPAAGAESTRADEPSASESPTDARTAPMAGSHYVVDRNWKPDFEPPKDLLFIVLDTLRADHLGLYGYERDTSPRLDAWAQKALVFDDVTSAASNTAPSHMSMFTGLLPPVHGVFNVLLGPSADETDAPQLLSPSIKTLAEYLHEAGFLNFALTDGGYLAEEMHFDRGFDRFTRWPQTVDDKVDGVINWFKRSADPKRRNFVFLHTYEVHAPYVPPEEHDVFTDPEYQGPVREKVEALRRTERGGVVNAVGFLPTELESPEQREYLVGLYDGCVRFVDTEIGRLLDYIENSEWGRRTAVVIVSDHGEAFGEHGALSHKQLYESIVHVPWMMRIPGGPVGRRDDPVSGVDVLPTLLGLLGLDAPQISDGVNILAGVKPDRPRLSYHADPRKGGGVGYKRYDLKLLRNMSTAPWEAYHLGRDPGEQQALGEVDQLVTDFTEIMRDVARDQAKLRELLGADAGGTGELSDETLKSLRALGYVK